MWHIPLSDLNYDSRESEAVQQVLSSGWLTMGPRTKDFERKFAAVHGADSAVAVANCTCALDLVYRFVLKQAGPRRRSIIVPDITFVATANAVIAAGGTPILCDIESPEQPTLSYAATEALLSSRSDIAAVVIVHYAGYDAGAESMAELCAKHDVFLIEDCAHSPGAVTPSGRPLGTIGIAGCFSFFSNKNISTGEGGMIVSRTGTGLSSKSQDLIDWARLVRSHGTTGGGTWGRHISGKSDYDVEVPGFNYRFTEVAAATGIVQLDKLDAGNNRRRELTTLYYQLLSEVEEVRVLPDFARNETSACHILPVLASGTNTREGIQTALSNAGIQTSHHYPPIHSLTWYDRNDILTSPSLENSIAFAARELTLPLHPKLRDEQVQEIVHAIKTALT